MKFINIKPSSNEHYKKLLDMLIEEMRQGEIPWKKSWFSRLPTNYKTKKVYKGINVLNLNYFAKVMGYQSHYWLTEIQAQSLGGKIKRDQINRPHFIILAQWKSNSWRDREGNEHINCWLMMRSYPIFNVVQATGLNVKRLENNFDLFGTDDKAENIIRNYKHPPKIFFDPESAFYLPFNDSIGIPKFDQFTCLEEYYGTLFHELIHSTGHRSRLDRESFRRKIIHGDDLYAKEELVAEIGSAFLSSHCGFFSQNKKNSAAYLSSWLNGLENDNTILFRTASNAQ